MKKKKKDKQEKKGFLSLRVILIFIMIMCWIVPIGAMGGASIYFARDIIDRKINDSIAIELEYSAAVATIGIDSVIVDSRNASYDRVIYNAYVSYKHKLKDTLTITEVEQKLMREQENEQEFKKSVEKYMYEKFRNKDKIRMVNCFLLEDPEKIYYLSRSSEDDREYYDENIHARAIQMSQYLDTKIGFIVQDNHIYLVRNLIDNVNVYGSYPRYGEYAVLIFQFDIDQVFSKLKGNATWSDNITIMLNDAIGMLSIENESLKEIDDNILKTMESDTTKIVYGNDTVSFYGKKQMDSYTFSYKSEVENSKINNELDGMIKILMILMIILVPVIVFSWWFLNKSISKPVNKLVDVSSHIEKGEFGYTIDKVKSNKEFSYLIDSFNKMSLQLEHLFDRVYKEEIALRDAKILALQSQINPHFLNNTLELMNWQARLAGDDEVANMITALSTMMEATLNRSNKPLVELREELQYSDAYLYIIHQRFGEKVKIEKDIDEDILKIKVPRLIIQPFIENAVEHGIEPKGKGTIYIHIYKDSILSKEDIVIEIKNDGMEMTEEELQRLNSLSDSDEENGHRSLGVRNVKQRLNLIYGQKSKLIIKSDKKQGTIVQIIISNAQDEQ